MITHSCDKCGRTSTQKKGEKPTTPDGWLDLRPGGYSRSVLYEICPECQDKLGIPEGAAQQETIGEKLIEILTEIAQGAMEE